MYSLGIHAKSLDGFHLPEARKRVDSGLNLERVFPITLQFHGEGTQCVPLCSGPRTEQRNDQFRSSFAAIHLGRSTALFGRAKRCAPFMPRRLGSWARGFSSHPRTARAREKTGLAALIFEPQSASWYGSHAQSNTSVDHASRASDARGGPH